MNPIIAVQDDFFDDYLGELMYFQHAEFGDFKLGVDGVVYPFICTKILHTTRYEFLYKLERLLGARVKVNYLFARAMPDGVSAPSKIHSDRDMGAYTAHVYLSPGPQIASTSFLCHRTLGQVATPEMNGSEWSQDASEWKQYLTIWGAPNRLLVHRAEYFHRAEPETGFGRLGKDARMVLTCFFDVL